MPELPEVETTLLGLKPHILQQTVLAVTIRQYQLRWPIHPNLSSELIGQTVLNLTRRGKYIIVALNRGSLLIHLGMSGRCAVLPVTTPAKKHDHVDIQITAQMLLRYTDPRRFGAIVWIPDTNPLEHPLLAKLGLEPFDPKFDGDYLWERAQNKKMLLKAFIMDQRIVVGVGNIYATEALFKTGLHPALPCKLVNKQQMHQLAQTIQSLLKYAIQAGGTSLKDFLQADGKPGYFKLQLQIYDKATQPCPICKNPLEKMQIGQRSSVFCAICQPKPTRHPENGIPV